MKEEKAKSKVKAAKSARTFSEGHDSEEQTKPKKTKRKKENESLIWRRCVV